MRVAAIIPARGGSKGLPGKNLKTLGGAPLVARTVRAAAGAALVDAVLVSSDSAEILRVAEDWGGEPVLRPPELSGDAASSESAILHALERLSEAGRAPQVVAFLQCTSPFTTTRDVDSVIAPVLSGEADSAFSATEFHGFLWRIDADGLGLGVNHDHAAPRQRRQDAPAQYLETGAVYTFRADRFVEAGHRFCGRTQPVPVRTEPIEIDTPDDWRRAEALAGQLDRGSLDRDRLARVKAVVMDFDGVHTDDRVLVDETGREAVFCSRRDGMGIERLRKAGYRLLILSKERNPVVRARAEKLQVEVAHGVDAKREVLDAWRRENGFDWPALAFIGNDVNDVECLEAAGVSFAPADAHLSAKRAADLILAENGGDGALRALSEIILGEA